MGASGSTDLQVTFNHPNSLYFAGDQVSGNISFRTTQDSLTLNGVFMECIGEMEYMLLETRQVAGNNGVTKTDSSMKTHITPFMNIRFPVAEPLYGQREITLYRGQHSWPFEFVLPHCLPPTLLPAPVSHPYVRYYARVVLDKSWYKPNARQVYPLTVFPRVNLLYTPGGQQPIAFQNQNRKKIRLQGFLVQGGVVPGGKLSVQIDLQNPKQVIIKRIEAALVQHRLVGRSNHMETIFRLDLPDIREFTNVDLQRTFELNVPSVFLSPTYTYLAQSLTPPVGISIHYELVLDVKVRGLFTDFKMSVPVVLGTAPLTAEQQQLQQQMSPPVQMPVPSAPVFEYDEPPPSYETVVTNQKI